MTGPFTHNDLTCWVGACGNNLAAWVVEAKAPAPHAAAGETETYYQLCCDDTSCLILSEAWANRDDLRLADVRVLTRGEAQAISGDQLDEEVGS